MKRLPDCPFPRRAPGVAALLTGTLVAAACSAGTPGSNETPAPGTGAAPPATTAQDPAPLMVRPGAPGEETRVLGTGSSPGSPMPHTAADVIFMQDMILHHMQALEMSALVENRSESPDIRLLGRRIVVSQVDEIELARRWLEDRGEEAPTHDAQHQDHSAHSMMPGMISPAQMEHLEAARGRDFDILFLAAMIQHHQGALVMVADLFASPGAAHEDGIFQFASHVESDQRVEIARMQRMLDALLAARQ
jgi:uncharacterized protein (DUF305 family)